MVEAESIVIYHKDGSVQINLPNIWTLNRILFKGMTVVKKEGSHFDAIEILGIYDDDKYVYLTIKNIKTGRVNVISQILDRDNTYFLWSIISLDYFQKMLENRIMNQLIIGNTVTPQFHLK